MKHLEEADHPWEQDLCEKLRGTWIPQWELREKIEARKAAQMARIERSLGAVSDFTREPRVSRERKRVDYSDKAFDSLISQGLGEHRSAAARREKKPRYQEPVKIDTKYSRADRLASRQRGLGLEPNGASNEMDVAFFAAGHHATERYGAKALGEHVAANFDVEVEFVDIDNPV